MSSDASCSRCGHNVNAHRLRGSHACFTPHCDCVTWFANAIETGRSACHRRGQVANLEHSAEVVTHLNAALENLSAAHTAAGETEGDRTNLLGPLRDVIFGLNSAVEALAAMVEDELLERVGSVLYDGDEYHDFRYAAAGEPESVYVGRHPVYVVRPDPPRGQE